MTTSSIAVYQKTQQLMKELMGSFPSQVDEVYAHEIFENLITFSNSLLIMNNKKNSFNYTLSYLLKRAKFYKLRA